MASIVNRLRLSLQKCEQVIQVILGHGFPPPGLLCAADCNSFLSVPKPVNRLGSQSLKEILENGILWAVPKSRRSLAKRLVKKHGYMENIWKPYVANKATILVCPNCGHNYEANHLCGHCYEKVKIETKEMQQAIQKELGIEPVEQDVIVLYDGEKDDKTLEFWKNQRIIEMPKKRPAWFQRNLLEPTTQQLSDQKDIKPDNLA